jgi:hypothetical protein
MAEAFFALTHGGSLRAAQTARAVKSGLFTVDDSALKEELLLGE